jgi:putative hydrolase of the HAD superfamily
MTTRAIFFDLDGTLLEWRRGYREILAETFESVVNELRAEWIEQYNDAFYESFEAHEPNPVRRAFTSVVGCSKSDQLAEELRRQEARACHPPEGAYRDLERLSADDSLGVLTNGVPEWQRYKLREHDLERYFDAIVASYEAGAHKPNAAPYRAAERRLPADTYAMIGDDEADTDGARNVGWTTYRYDGGGFEDVPVVLERE